jgi:hypothetical protein
LIFSDVVLPTFDCSPKIGDELLETEDCPALVIWFEVHGLVQLTVHEGEFATDR